MIESETGLVLASASPRRREILAQLGLVFRVLPSTVPEVRDAGEEPAAFARRLADSKAGEVASRLKCEVPAPYVLGADTVVVIDQEILGKPAGENSARAMLRRLSGRTHTVITAVALRRADSSYLDEVVVSTLVSFRELDESTVVRYVASGEGRDKAGSYAIQGLGAGLVSEIRGSYSNVIGLPATQTLQLLERAGVVREWP